MRCELVIAENSLDPESWEVIETDDICEVLSQRWDSLPQNTRIYHEQVADCFEVTPKCEKDIEKLQLLEGRIYVIVYPEFFLFALGGLGGILKSLLLTFVLGIITYLLTPKPPKPRNTQEDSPNNGLSDRKNEARPGARIPDIFGRVRSTPDMLSQPYFVFETHREVEYSYLCVGRGEYLIKDVKDDDTPVEDIAGLSVEFYSPYTSPHSDDEPFLRIGSPIQERIWTATRSNAVNGQILRPPNAVTVEGDDSIAFNWPDQVVTGGDHEVDFEEFFGVDDVVTITGASFTGDVGGVPTNVNLSGTYIVLAVDSNTLVLNNPAAVNSDWDIFGTFDDPASPFTNADISTSSNKWVGPFVVEEPYAIYSNFVAVNGLYKDDGEEQEGFDVQILIEFTPVDEDGNPTGTTEDEVVTIKGSDHLTNLRAITSKYTVVPTAEDADGKRWEVRARRLTDTDLDFEGRVVDEIQWRDLYGMRYVTEEHFGNVTTCFLRTYATNAALTIKDRKLNCWATRKIPVRVQNPDGTYSITEYTVGNFPTSYMGVILRQIALDEHLGNMSEDELDYKSIFKAESTAITYFGTTDVVQFNHTFDDKETSLEEMISAVAEACFCTAYRQGDKLKLLFERKSNNNSLLFNHRNKLPGSE